MWTLTRISSYIFTITNQSKLLHQSLIWLHNWRKTENFMENLKIRKYLFFTLFDRKIIKIIQNDIYVERFRKNVIEAIKWMLYWSCQTMQWSKRGIFRYFFSIFWRVRGTILLNSVILKENFYVNIGQNKKLHIHN